MDNFFAHELSGVRLPGAPPGRRPSTESTSNLQNSNGSGKWFSRDYLPHFDQSKICQFLTFRLFDSVPRETIDKWKSELKITSVDLPENAPEILELHKRIEHYEDAGHGECFLRRNDIAELTENALLHFDGKRYRLLAWCIMPNHVHVLIETLPDCKLSGIIHSWKSFVAHKANAVSERNGEFWQREYYDRYIRDGEHFARTLAYIEDNPVKARLAPTAQAYPWSSARRPGNDKKGSEY